MRESKQQTNDEKRKRTDMTFWSISAVIFVLTLFVGTRPALGTLYIRDDETGGDATSIGTWDWPTKTCTLTGDVSEDIRIESDGITLDGAGYTLIGPGTESKTIGIYVSQRTHVTLKNLNIKEFAWGIQLLLSSSNTLENISATNNAIGIGLHYSSDNNTLIDNTASSCGNSGIYLFNVSNNTLTDNAVTNGDVGISLEESSGNTMSGNTMSGNAYNLRVRGNYGNDYDNDIDTSNTVDGKPVYFLNGVTGETYDSSTNAGVLFAVNCDGITIKDLTLTKNLEGVFLWNTHNSRIENISASDNRYGISLRRSNNNTVIGNTLSSNYETGIGIYEGSSNNIIMSNTLSNNVGAIYLYSGSNNNTLEMNCCSNNRIGFYFQSSCDGNTLRGNMITNGEWGIALDMYCDNNIITGNTVSNNENVGFLVALANENEIYNNNFIANGTQVSVLGYCSGNVFNMPWPAGGNYWSDYTGEDTDGDGIGETAYAFTGGVDELPWVAQDGWVPPTPQETLEALIDYVIFLNIQEGISNSLDAKLDAALQALDDLNENNDVAAINALEAFINSVEAQRGNKIPEEDADALIAGAEEIIVMLNGA